MGGERTRSTDDADGYWGAKEGLVDESLHPDAAPEMETTLGEGERAVLGTEVVVRAKKRTKGKGIRFCVGCVDVVLWLETVRGKSELGVAMGCREDDLCGYDEDEEEGDDEPDAIQSAVATGGFGVVRAHRWERRRGLDRNVSSLH